MTELRAVLKANPDFSSAYVILGGCLDKVGRTQEAIENYEEGLRRVPENFDAYVRLGIALESQGKYEEARTKFLKATELNPRYLEAYVRYILASDKIGRSADAVSVARKALDLARSLNRTDKVQALQNWLAEHDSSMPTRLDYYGPKK